MRSTKDCLALLQRGDQNRIFASTEMNAHSSRSHAIVIVTVIKRRKRAITRNDNGEEVTGQCAPSYHPTPTFPHLERDRIAACRISTALTCMSLLGTRVFLLHLECQVSSS